MGFALWIKQDLAWAQGTHEYRPMGTAVVSIATRFAQRDFDRRRRGPSRMDPGFSGLFASLGEMNDFLEKRRLRNGQSQVRKKKFRTHLTHSVPPF